MTRIFFLALFFIPTASIAQLGVSFHQSNLPFAGISYEIKDRFRPELRIGTDNFLDYDYVSLELSVMYDILNKDEYEFYAGLGLKSTNFEGLVIPVGINIYPFNTKNFGFHIELSPILGDDYVLRGSWGIRYRFPRKPKEENLE